jgi:1-acyl-sn-glycerol-3-phosphate acyltransferase
MGLAYTLMAIADTARISVPTVYESLDGRLTTARCDERLAWWARSVVRNAKIDLVVRGAEHASGADPLIVMSNHQSLYDIPVLYAAVPGSMRMVAKAELFEIPIWGRAMTAAGFVRVERKNREQAVSSLKAATSMLSHGVRLWIAPEGTRSATGELGAFKSGGFRMAIDTATPILPVAVRGTRDVLPSHSLVVQPGKRVVVAIRPRIDPAPYGLDGRKQLMADVRAEIERALADAAEA